MLASADILIANLVTFGALLLVLLVGCVVVWRVVLRGIGALLRRLDPGGELHRRWVRQLSRIFALVATTIGLALLAGGVLLTHYEIDAGAHLRAWAEQALLADGAGMAWTAGKLLAVMVGAPALFAILRRALAAIGELLARAAIFASRAEPLALLFTRLRATLRAVFVFGALLVATRAVTDSQAALYPLAVLTYVAVGTSLARGLAAGAHLAIDLAFDVSGGLATRTTPLRYLGRLQGLAGVTRRVTDYFIYVGTATIVSYQLAPGTLLAQWGQVAIRVIAILYVSRVVVELVEVVLREALATRSPEASETEHQQRLTLVPVATSLARYTIYIFSAAMALSELGLDTTPLFAAAGLMGIAVGLGAQAIVSDLVSGFFILFEGIFLVGHRVQIGEYIGNVEEIGVRVTRVRDDFGVVHAIPNGEIRCVSSYSQQYVNAIVEFGVPYEEDLSRTFAVVKARLATVREAQPEILDETQIVVQELRESALWIRTVTRVAPGQDDPMCEVLRYEIATALAEAGIRPPHAYRVIRQLPVRPGERASER